jgi:hypothetical protein
MRDENPSHTVEFAAAITIPSVFIYSGTGAVTCGILMRCIPWITLDLKPLLRLDKLESCWALPQTIRTAG